MALKYSPQIRCSCSCCVERLKRRYGRVNAPEEEACICSTLPVTPVDPDNDPSRCDCELCAAAIAAAAA